MPKKGAKLGASSLEDMAGARRATHEGEDKGRAEEGSSSVGSSTRDGRGETKVGGCGCVEDSRDGRAGVW